jgi:FkbM family methyltransferase
MKLARFIRNPLVKDIARRVFHAAGLQVTLTSTRRQTMSALIDHVLKLGFRPRTVIDVGVEKGTPGLYGRFPDARLLLIEPLREFEPVLQKICRKYNATYVLAAAGASPGTATLNVHPNHMGGSSTYRESEGAHIDGHPRIVSVVTLDQMCAEHRLPGPYLIKVDVQGAELDVLDGATEQVLADTELVILEVSLFGFFIGGPQFYDVVRYMKERGFVVYDIVGGGNRPFDGALAQVDMAFVRENGIFREHHIYWGAVV